jgi:hypothetical protein
MNPRNLSRLHLLSLAFSAVALTTACGGGGGGGDAPVVTPPAPPPVTGGSTPPASTPTTSMPATSSPTTSTPPASSPTTSTPPASTPTAGGIFQKTHPWNTDVSALAASSRSAAIIGALNTSGGWNPSNRLQIDFSIPVFYADASTPKTTVTSSSSIFYSDASDPLPLQIPIPANANAEGSANLLCDVTNQDCHVLVVDRAQNKLYELFSATTAGSKLEVALAATWDLTKQYTDVLRGDQCSGADASGMPMTALIPTADEVAAGEIKHALRFRLPNASMKRGVFVRPATNAGAPNNASADAPPVGVRLRLKASFDETAYSASARVVLTAMKKYGMILSEGGNLPLTFADDRTSTAKWATLGISALTFSAINASNFEVVGLGAEITKTNVCVRAP